MSEQRRVRFASIEGLAREDLPLAGEVWLNDIYRAPWASRECMKLAAHLVGYMASPDPKVLQPREIERESGLVRDDVIRALGLMRTFRAVEAFTVDREEVRAALNLSIVQRLEVLEKRRRLAELTEERTGLPAPLGLPVKEPRWVPPPPRVTDDGEDAVSPLVALIAESIRRSARELEDSRAA